MRTITSPYDNGEPVAAETATEGSMSARKLLGERRVSRRIAAYAEVACDDTDKRLEWTLEEVQKRRNQPAAV